MGVIRQGLLAPNHNNAVAEAHPEKYAMIAGQQIELPGDARFYFQDKRGCWFWSTRKPRVKDDDWTPNKNPVQINNERGYLRCLITPSKDSRSASWQDTVMRVINPDHMPLAMP
ncbi:MAG: hypothetical protein ABJ308_18230 [Halieaceae bacterium]